MLFVYCCVEHNFQKNVVSLLNPSTLTEAGALVDAVHEATENRNSRPIMKSA